MVAINTILAESLDFIAGELESAVAAGTDFNDAVQALLKDIITTHGAVVFNGDGYADAWQEEAAARGLPNLRTSVEALPEYDTDEAQELFSAYGVLNHRELDSRYEVALEQYSLSVAVEARSTLELATTTLLPSALRYQTELAVNAASLQAIGYEFDPTSLDEVSAGIGQLRWRWPPCGRSWPMTRTARGWTRPPTPARCWCPPPWRCAPRWTGWRTAWRTTSGRCPPTQEMLFIL